MSCFTSPPLIISFAFAGMAGCSGSHPEPATAEPPAEQGPQRVAKKAGFSAEADIGALSEQAVTETFRGAQGRLAKCFETGSSKLPFLAGDVRFHVRVNVEGRATTVHLTKSLGDRDTERCMIDVLLAARWPAPQGGKEGIAETEFAFEPPSGVRAAVNLQGRALGSNVERLKAAVRDCRSNAGAGPLSVTLYVDPDGGVEGVGVAASDAAGEKAADCVVKAAKELRFDSPGSYTGKAIVES